MQLVLLAALLFEPWGSWWTLDMPAQIAAAVLLGGLGLVVFGASWRHLDT